MLGTAFNKVSAGQIHRRLWLVRYWFWFRQRGEHQCSIGQIIEVFGFKRAQYQVPVATVANYDLARRRMVAGIDPHGVLYFSEFTAGFVVIDCSAKEASIAPGMAVGAE